MLSLKPDELIVDCFAGGGGASQGIFMATGRHPDVAINHDPEAIAMHAANHPQTDHYCKSVYHVDPDDIIRKYQRPIGFAWFSPDCTHHSKARGGKPKEKHIRDLAWVVVHWAERAVYRGQRIRKIAVENVEEFKEWGPLLADGQPDPERKGEEFVRWLQAMRKLGYKAEWRELVACHYGANTSRKRLVIVFSHDEKIIRWPVATHGPGRAHPYGTAAECIHWSLPCPSIFLTKEQARAVRAKRPLAEPTMRRIALGIKRFVLDAEKPFIVNLTHQGGQRVEPLDEPMRTVTGAHRGEKALVSPFLARTAQWDVDSKGKRRGKGQHSVEEPIGAVTASRDHALCTPFLAGCGGRAGQSPPRAVDRPYHTTTSKADTCIVAPILTGAGGPEYAGRPTSVDRPFRTITKENHTAVATATIAPIITEHANASNPRSWSADEPLRTQCAQVKGGHFALGAASLVQMGYGERDGQEPRALDPQRPLGTVVAGGVKHAVVTAMLTSLYSAKSESDCRCTAPGNPIPTITTTPCHALATGHLVKLRGTCQHGQPADEPLATISAQGTHLGAVTGHLMKYYGNERDGAAMDEPLDTVTSRDRFSVVRGEIAPLLTEEQAVRARLVADLLRRYGLWDEREYVTLSIEGLTWVIADIGLRMLTPRELYNAQGFPPDYIIAPEFNGKKLTNSASVRMCGNSVAPHMAMAVTRALFSREGP